MPLCPEVATPAGMGELGHSPGRAALCSAPAVPQSPALSTPEGAKLPFLIPETLHSDDLFVQPPPAHPPTATRLLLLHLQPLRTATTDTPRNHLSLSALCNFSILGEPLSYHFRTVFVSTRQTQSSRTGSCFPGEMRSPRVQFNSPHRRSQPSLGALGAPRLPCTKHPRAAAPELSTGKHQKNKAVQDRRISVAPFCLLTCTFQ